MRYHVWTRGPFRRGMIETWDGVVTKATPAFAWAIGRRLDTVIYHYQNRGYEVTLTDAPPMPSLSETPGAPTDAELANRTRS